MQLELLLSNDQQALAGARGLISEALRQLPLTEALIVQLEQLVVQRVSGAIDHAYPPGEEGSIRLTVSERQGRLEILIRDYGLPQDVAQLEQRLHASGETSSIPPEFLQGVDEVHWLGYGREGKAFQIVKWLHERHIAETEEAATLQPFTEQAPLAPQQNYEIRRLRPEEAVQVSQLMYRAYGNTYFNEDVYYPERVAALNAQNVNLSFVAVAEDGTVVGHYALELNQPGPVGEGGQAVVDPAHRGRGLLEKLKAAVLATAEELQLTGWYADAVAVHTFTQKSNATHGGHVTAADLGIAPRSERFRNIAAEQPQRISCLLYFHWLKQPAPREISIPERHREIVTRLYQGLGCDVTIISAFPAEGHGTLSIQIDTGGAKAFLRAEQLGADTVHAIARAQRELIEQSRMEAVYVELPLSQPGTAIVAEALEPLGFGFIGIVPHFSTGGDLLRLVYLVEPLEREPIKTFEDLADQLVEYALHEQERVRALL